MPTYGENTSHFYMAEAVSRRREAAMAVAQPALATSSTYGRDSSLGRSQVKNRNVV